MTAEQGPDAVNQLRETLRAFVEEICNHLAGVSVPGRVWRRVQQASPVDSERRAVAIPFGHRWIQLPIETRPELEFLTMQGHVEPIARQCPTCRATLLTLGGIVTSSRLADRLDMLKAPPDAAEADGWPARFFWRFLVPFLIAYFRESEGPWFEERAFNLAFNVVESELGTVASPKLVTPLLNVWLVEDEIILGQGVKLRQVTASEIEEWLNSVVYTTHGPAAPIMGAHDIEELQSVQCALEVIAPDQVSDMDTLDAKLNCPMGTELTERSLSALRLLRPVTFSLLTELRLPGLVWGHRGFALYRSGIDRHDMPQLLGRDDGARLAELFTRMGAQPNSRLALAINRFEVAIARPNATDKLIDYWVALEALFSPSKDGEIKYRASFRIAGYLGDTGRERKALYKVVKDSYDLRSEIVHGADIYGKRGGRRRTGAEVVHLVEESGGILRRAILKMLDEPPGFDSNQLEARYLETNWDGDVPEQTV